MMAPDNKEVKPARKGESQSSSSKKTSATPKEQALKCPRCDSMNTKFCYYNNYSLTQPRHFCKTCRRYWTHGGALRNVPIGGGCRKSKKLKPSLKFSSGFSPAMDYHTSTAGVYNQLSSFGDISSTSSAIASTPLLGFNFPLPCFLKKVENSGGFGGDVQEMGDITSSIQSLSSINQDLHWKLQQQRFAMLFGGDNQIQMQKPQPIMFQNLDISKPDNLATEWFFDNYAQVNTTPTPTPTNNSNNGNGGQPWSSSLNQA